MEVKVGQCFYPIKPLKGFSKKDWTITILAKHNGYLFVETRIIRRDLQNRVDASCSTVWENDFVRSYEFSGITNVKRK